MDRNPDSTILYSNYGEAVIAYIELCIVAKDKNKERKEKFYFALATYSERPINKFAVHVWREES